MRRRAGLPALREAVAAHYGRHFGQQLAAEHVCVTSGATEALGAAILATVEPGDEVIIFTPAYDSYAPMIRRAGGDRRVEVALQPPEWRIDRDGDRGGDRRRRPARSCSTTRTIPPGGCSTPTSSKSVAAVARDHDLIVISDEVWEHILLDGRRFTPLATLPGMAERTIKIGSAGKIFSLTGWKVGWMVAAPELADVVARAHQFLTFCDRAEPAGRGGVRARRGRCLDRADARPLRARARPDDARACATPASPCSTPPRPISCASTSQASGIDVDDESFAAAAVEKAGRRGRAAVRLCRAATRRGTSSACASARRTRRSTPASPRWPRRRRCSA